MADGAALVLHVALGIALAASAGLRTFIPLAVVGLAGRAGFVVLATRFEWLASGPALTILGVAVVVELLADKFPGVDHLLDVAALVVKPCAGALLVASVVTDLSPLGLTIVSILAGGGVATVVHASKAKLRLVSTVTTGGVGNPALSLMEDVGSLAGSVLAIVAPLVVVLGMSLAALLTWCVLVRRRRD